MGRNRAGDVVSIRSTYIGIFNGAFDRIQPDKKEKAYVKLRVTNGIVEMLISYSKLKGFSTLLADPDRKLLSTRPKMEMLDIGTKRYGMYEIEALTAVEDGANVYTLKQVK